MRRRTALLGLYLGFDLAAGFALLLAADGRAEFEDIPWSGWWFAGGLAASVLVGAAGGGRWGLAVPAVSFLVVLLALSTDLYEITGHIAADVIVAFFAFAVIELVGTGVGLLARAIHARTGRG